MVEHAVRAEPIDHLRREQFQIGTASRRGGIKEFQYRGRNVVVLDEPDPGQLSGAFLCFFQLYRGLGTVVRYRDKRL